MSELAIDHTAESERLQVRLDELELSMLDQPELLVDLPLVHRFTPGIYTREIFMPAGTLVTSRIHKIRHPYTVLRGRLSVLNVLDGSVVHIEAPHVGITEPGTRRLLFIHEDTVWITFHPNPDDLTDLSALEDRLIERRELQDGHNGYELYVAALRGLGIEPKQQLIGGTEP